VDWPAPGQGGQIDIHMGQVQATHQGGIHLALPVPHRGHRYRNGRVLVFVYNNLLQHRHFLIQCP
jgi:hypothetical protein